MVRLLPVADHTWALSEGAMAMASDIGSAMALMVRAKCSRPSHSMGATPRRMVVMP